MSVHACTHSSQMKTPAGPAMSLLTWLRVFPQKEQRISPPNESVSLLGMCYSWLWSVREVMTLSTRPYSQASAARM